MTADIFVPQVEDFLPASVQAALQLAVFVPEVRTIILFGSRAVGDHDEKSDFDIAISAPRLARNEFIKLRDAVAHSRTLFKISLSLLEKMPERLQNRVTSQGLKIYERKET
jgi:uncharacterized protein